MIQTLQWIYFLALPVIIGSWLERCHNASTVCEGNQGMTDLLPCPFCGGVGFREQVAVGREKPDPDWDAWLKPAIDVYGPKTK